MWARGSEWGKEKERERERERERKRIETETECVQKNMFWEMFLDIFFTRFLGPLGLTLHIAHRRQGLLKLGLPFAYTCHLKC